MIFTKNSMIGKINNTSCIYLHFKHNNAINNDPDHISNIICNISLHLLVKGPNHATAIPESKNNIFIIALNIIQIVCS